MTHNEMIAVIQAHRDGLTIESRKKGSRQNWQPVIVKPSWNFSINDYRVSNLKWRHASIEDVKQPPVRCRVRNGEFQDWVMGELVGWRIETKPNNETIGRKWAIMGDGALVGWDQCQVQDDS